MHPPIQQWLNSVYAFGTWMWTVSFHLPRALVWRCAGATTVVPWAPARCPSCFRHCRSVLPSGQHWQKCCCDPSQHNGAPAPGTTLHEEAWKGWPPTRSMHLAGLTRASKWLALPWRFIMLWSWLQGRDSRQTALSKNSKIALVTPPFPPLSCRNACAMHCHDITSFHYGNVSTVSTIRFYFHNLSIPTHSPWKPPI